MTDVRSNNRPATQLAALYFAEGWLSKGYNDLFLSGWNGARFAGYPSWKRLFIAKKIAKDMKARGLYKGCRLSYVNKTKESA